MGLALSNHQSGAMVAAAPQVPVAPPTTGPVTLAIHNIHCGACIRPVEAALAALPGVISARVNLSDRRAVITRDRNAATLDDMIAALRDIGFTATELAETSECPSGQRQTDLLRRLAVTAFAAMNIMLLSVAVWSGHSGDMDASTQSLFHWISAVIAVPAVAYGGQPFFISAAEALRGRRLNMDVPISLGVLLATAMSLFQTSQHADSVYFDAAVMLLAFLLAGRFLDESVRRRATGAAHNLLKRRVTDALAFDDTGQLVRLPAAELAVGTLVHVAAGERIAVDGTVVDGNSAVDQSLLTGEALPHAVSVGSPVHGGTINLNQSFVMRVDRTEQRSLLTEIAELMSAAEQNRGRYVRLAERAARIYAPAVHALGLITFVAWLAMGGGWEVSLTNAISVLIVTCPCALALAVPTVQVAASSRLFTRGIILKVADGLERLSDVDTVVFDKTGTLTHGTPQVVNLDVIPKTVLAAAAALSQRSRHPYARAISDAARDAGLNVKPFDDVAEQQGLGLSHITPHGEARLGSAAFCGQHDDAEDGPSSVFFRSAHGDVVRFEVSDTLRDDVACVVKGLHDRGLNVELLSGDQVGAVRAAAKASGIRMWRGRQTPQHKLQRLAALSAAGHRVLMVGDGLNDAPALAAAHASLSPANAADVTQTAADAIVLGSHLAPVLDAIDVAHQARRLSLQNVALAIAYNIVFVPLAMSGAVTPLIAAVAMSLSSITVTLNAVRLRAPNWR